MVRRKEKIKKANRLTGKKMLDASSSTEEVTDFYRIHLNQILSYLFLYHCPLETNDSSWQLIGFQRSTPSLKRLNSLRIAG